jgi:hypothetical protein
MQAAIALVKAELDPSARPLQENTEAVNGIWRLACPLNFADTAHPNKSPPNKSRGAQDSNIVDLILLARDTGCGKVHDVLCASLAETIDKRPVGVICDMLGGESAAGCCQQGACDLQRLPEESSIAVLAAVRDLDKATAVRACYGMLAAKHSGLRLVTTFKCSISVCDRPFDGYQ